MNLIVSELLKFILSYYFSSAYTKNEEKCVLLVLKKSNNEIVFLIQESYISLVTNNSYFISNFIADYYFKHYLENEGNLIMFKIKEGK